MEKDIETLNKVMSLKTRLEIFENYFSWIYLFTNENLKGYYEEIDFNEKTVLTVSASGDHILNAILLGAKNIDAFDINPLAKYIVELKIAAIKSLELEEFILFFNSKKIINRRKYFFNKDVYNKKIRDNLNDNYRKFWDYVFTNYSSNKIYNSHLFTDDYLDIKNLIKSNLYLNEEFYYKLRNLLKYKKITYHDISLKDVDKIGKKFDIIILSNIPTYLNMIYSENELENLKNILNKIKKVDSKIVVSYLYYNLIDTKYISIHNKNSVEKHFPNKEYEYLQVKSADALSHKYNLSKRFDEVLISKDK